MVQSASSTNRLSRLVKAPKRYLTDTSLLMAALQVDELAVMRYGDDVSRRPTDVVGVRAG
jgi:hypothetical protein